MNDLAARAAKGDTKAKAAIEKYEALQNASPR
jgi:hypothetical protein